MSWIASAYYGLVTTASFTPTLPFITIGFCWRDLTMLSTCRASFWIALAFFFATFRSSLKARSSASSSLTVCSLSKEANNYLLVSLSLPRVRFSSNISASNRSYGVSRSPALEAAIVRIYSRGDVDISFEPSRAELRL